MLCWKYSKYGNVEEGNIIVNDLEFKEKIRTYEPTISNSNIDSCFTTFIKRGIMKRLCKGKYELNSLYFFKGTLSDRTKLQFRVEVDPKTNISTSFLVFSIPVKDPNLYAEIETIQEDK